METTLNWKYIKESGLPYLADDKPRAFLICYRVELGEPIQVNGRKVGCLPTGKFLECTTIALIQKNESKDGFVYTPAMKFYWGPDIFENVYAWAELPKAIPFR